jgi:transitional endoplasmic reticulum ATPase
LDSIGLNYSDRFHHGRYKSIDDVQANYDYKVLLKRFKTITSVLSDDNIIVTKSIKSNDHAIIGYKDIKKYIKKRLEPYKNPEQAKKFGLKKIAGIILYGPPGCGKTLWATQIAKYLGLKFEEIPRSIFGSTYVDGAMKGLENKLDEVERKSPIAIFFDEFDSVGTARENESGSNDENRKVVNTLLQRIPKLLEKGIIILAATNFINDLDSALIRPGRFDLHIPIMLPLPQERAEIILHYLTENSPEAILHILSDNLANVDEYWLDYSELMYLFSNSHVIDFCNELRDIMYEKSRIADLDEIVFTDEIIFEIINRVKSKIRKKDIDLHKRFYAESINLMDVFKDRMERLKYEIDKFDTIKGNNYRPVGFKPLK